MARTMTMGKYFDRGGKWLQTLNTGLIVREIFDKIVVFGERNDTHDIPKSKIQTVGKNVFASTIKESFADVDDDVTDLFNQQSSRSFWFTAVLGTPLMTLFAALWLHESDTLSPPPGVAQFAFCLVSSFRILKSANTVGTFVVYIPVTNTVVKIINTISIWL